MLILEERGSRSWSGSSSASSFTWGQDGRKRPAGVRDLAADRCVTTPRPRGSDVLRPPWDRNVTGKKVVTR